jgi:hypothetical protein
LLYLFAWLINDPFSVVVDVPGIGPFPFTPTQFAVVCGMAIVLASRQRGVRTRFSQKAVLWLLLYFAAVLAGFIYAYVAYGVAATVLFSIGANTVWFLTIAPCLSKGVSSQDWNKVQRMLIFGGMLAVLTGLWEFHRGDFLISTGPIMSKGTLPGHFWVRGLHVDRIDYATNIVMAMLVVVPALARPHVRTLARATSLLLTGVMLFLLVLSASWTGIVAGTAALLVGSALVVKGYSRVVLLLLLVATALMLVVVIPHLPNAGSLARSFETKYTRQVSDYETTNFRYLSIVASIRGFLSSPLMGIGLGRSGEYMRVALGLYKPIVPHTAITNVLLEQGLVGTVPFVGLIITLYSRLFRYLRGNSADPDEWLTYRVWIVGMGIFIAIRSISYFHYLDNSVYFLWAALLTARLGIRRRRQRAADQIPVSPIATSTALVG